MNKKVLRFEDLDVRVAAIAVAKSIYLKTLNLKDYYIRDQINRAALSISNNISEGFEYNNDPDFLRFLKYAKGSCGGTRSMLYFLKDLKMIQEDDFTILVGQVESISRQIMGLIKFIRTRAKEKQIQKTKEKSGSII